MLNHKIFIQRIAALLCIALVLGVFPAPVVSGAVSQDSSNLIPNSDFEWSEFLTHWAVSGQGDAAIATGVSGNQSNSLMLEDLSNKGHLEVLGTKFLVEQGATYHFELDVIADAAVADIANANVAVNIFWYDENGNWIAPDGYDSAGNIIGSGFYTNVKVTANTSAWKTFSKDVTVPAGTAQAAVRFNFYVAGINRVYVDNLSMVKTKDGSLDPIVPTVPPRPTEATQPTETTAPTQPPTQPPAPIDPSDFPLNSDFENVGSNGRPTDWSYGIGADCSLEVIDSDVVSGEKSIKITGGTKAIHLKTGLISVTPGKFYTLSVMSKLLSGGKKGYIGFWFYNASGTFVDAATISIGTTDEWSEGVLACEAPAGAATVLIELGYNTKSNSSSLVDKITFTESEDNIVTEPTDGLEIEIVDHSYPFLYFNQEELAQIKNYKNDREINAYGFSWRSQVETLVLSAERYLQETTVVGRSNYGTSVTFKVSPYLIDPNDPSYDQMYIDASKDSNGNLVEKPHLGFGSGLTETMRLRMETLSLAYVLTGDTRYSDLAIRYAVEMSGWKFWGDWDWLNGYTGGSAKADASNAWGTQAVVAVYDMCHDQLTQEQKEIIETAIIEKGLKPMYEHVKINNIQNANCMVIGGMLSGAAAIVNADNIEELMPYMTKALTALNNAFAQFAYSGNSEGHYYAGFGLEYLLPGALHFYRATGVEGIVDHPLLTQLLSYWTVMFAAPNTMTHPNYSDGSIAVQLVYPMAVLAKMTGDPLANYFLTEVGGAGTAFDNLIYLDPNPEIKVPTDYAAVVDPIGYGALRTGFADDDMLLTLKANNSQMSHNHFDQNAIMFNVGGNWLMGDPGVGSYYYADRYFWTHEGHNTILVDGKPQSVMGYSSARLIFNNELYSHIVGSAPKAYGVDEDGAVLEKFDRHAIQINHAQGAYYVVIDDLSSSKDHTYTWQMYHDSFTDFEATGNRVSIPIGSNVLNLEFVADAQLSIGRKDYGDGHFTFTATGEASKAYQFMTVISAGDANSVVVNEIYDTDEILGALIQNAEYDDLLVWNRTDGLVTVGDLKTDAKQASLLGLKNGVITDGYSAISATTLVYNGSQLFAAEKEIDIVATNAFWQINSSESQTVSLSVAEAGEFYTVYRNGEPVDAQILDGYLIVDVAAGENRIEIVAEARDLKAKFSNTGLSLGEFIGLQSAVMKKNLNGGSYDEAYFVYVHHTFDENGNPVEITERGEFIDGGTFLVAECKVNAKQMADVFEITPCYVVDGVTYYGTSTVTSVRAEVMKKLSDSKTDDKTRSLCIAMLNYGAESQKKFSYNLRDLANAELTDAQKLLPAFSDLDLTKTNNIPTTPYKPATSGLSLGDVVYMQFMLPMSKVDADGELQYMISGENVIKLPVADLDTYGKYYVISIPVKAKYVRSNIYIGLFDAEGVLAYGYMTCSVEGFAKNLQGSDNETLVAALMAYGDAAKAVFG